MSRRAGEFVEINGQLGVVVTLAHEQSFIPPDHICVWFGPTLTDPKPMDSQGRELPMVHFIPEDSCRDAARLEHE